MKSLTLILVSLLLVGGAVHADDTLAELESLIAQKALGDQVIDLQRSKALAGQAKVVQLSASELTLVQATFSVWIPANYIGPLPMHKFSPLAYKYRNHNKDLWQALNEGDEKGVAEFIEMYEAQLEAIARRDAIQTK